MTVTTTATVKRGKANDEPARGNDGKLLPVDVSRCPVTTGKGRRCKLVAGHAGYPAGAPQHNADHVYMFRSGVDAPKTLTELRAAGTVGATFTLTMEAVPKGTNLARSFTRSVAAPRDADQLKADKDAQKAYDAWAKAGKPGKFEDSPVQRYIVPPAVFNTVIQMLRRTTQAGGPMHGKKLSYRRAQHETGNAIINFTITDKGQDDANTNGASSN